MTTYIVGGLFRENNATTLTFNRPETVSETASGQLHIGLLTGAVAYPLVDDAFVITSEITENVGQFFASVKWIDVDGTVVCQENFILEVQSRVDGDVAIIDSNPDVLEDHEIRILALEQGGGGGDLVLGETSTTAYRGDRGKIAYDHTALTNNPHATTAAQVGAEPAKGTDDNYVTDAEKAALHSHSNKSVLDGTTASFTTADETKLDGIEALAEVNNISDTNATDLTDGGTTTLHSHTVTKSDVGLGNVDNTSDLNKPISTATQTALDSKQVFHGIQANGAITFDNSTHVVSVASITYWYQGAKCVSATPLTCDIDTYFTLAANTLYYIAFDDASCTLKAFNSMNLKTRVPLCMVYWNGTAGALTIENHNHTRNLDWHINAHRTIGTRYYTGLGLTSPTTTLDETLDIATGIIYDEDIAHTIPQSTTARLWRQASNGVYTFSDISLPFAGSTGAVQYLDTDTYALTAVGNAKFACMWVYATNDKDRPIYIIPTQAADSYNTAALARAEVPPSLTGLTSELAPEWKLIYRFIYRGDGQFQESADYRTVTSLPSGQVSTAQAASAVSVVPVGSIAATNVQSALEELDTEKAPALGADDNYVTDVQKTALNNLAPTTKATAGATITVDFATKSVVPLDITQTTAITVANVPTLGRASLILYCDGTARTVTWSGIGKWVSDVPTLTANKVTVVTLINDGVTVIAGAGSEA